MNQPLISVILPIYNVKKYLPQCMEALKKQTYANLEIVMVDDGSTDGCSEMCDELAKLDPRIIVYHKKNGGISDARNFGVENSKGQYVTYVDPDDIVDEDYVEYLYNIMMKYGTRMSIAQHRVCYSNGSVKDYGSEGDGIITAKECIERMLYHDVIDTSVWGKLYEKDLFKKEQYPVGKLFEDIGATYELMMRSEKIAIGYQSKYNYIFHQNSIVNSSFKPGKLDMLTMTDKMAKDVLKEYPDLEDAIIRRRVYSRLSTLNQMLYTKEYPEKKKEIIDFVKKNRKQVLKNRRAPKRDKLAIFLLLISYRIYRFCWIRYQKYIMDED